MSQVKAYNGDMPYIFVSYSHKDADIVLQMVSQMQADGYRAWYDEGIKPGVEWDDYIASKVSKCTYFIAFLSENYLASSNCKDEMNYARDHVDNILLVYLEQVSLPSGMEMRFGRSQAIFAYNYTSKNDFFHKLYLSKSIDQCKGNTSVEIVEETIDNIPTESYVAPSTAMSKASELNKPKSVKPEPAKQAEIPEIKVKRVPSPEAKAKNKKVMWINIAAFAVVVVAAIVIGIIIASNRDTNKNSKSDQTSETKLEVDESTSEDNTETSPVVQSDGHIEGVYSTYGLAVGEFDCPNKDADFYKNTGSPIFYDTDKQDYTDGTFSGVFAMVIEIPASSDYFEPLHIQWYYVGDNGQQELVADFYDIQVYSDEGVNWYDLNLSALDLGGEFRFGDYYAVVFAGDNTDEDMVVHVEYQAVS